MTLPIEPIYYEKSGAYTVCSIGGPFGSPDATYEAWHYSENLAVNLRSATAARTICREHAIKRQAAATTMKDVA